LKKKRIKSANEIIQTFFLLIKLTLGLLSIPKGFVEIGQNLNIYVVGGNGIYADSEST